MKNLFRRIDYRHYILILITVSFFITSFFVFPYAFNRLVESVKGLCDSCVYYFNSIFLGVENEDVSCKVMDLSEMPYKLAFNLPNDFEELKFYWKAFWSTFWSSSNFESYIDSLSLILYYICQVILFLMPLFLLFYIIINQYFKAQNNDYDKDSKALSFWKKFVDKVYNPVKFWFKNLFGFIKLHKFYYIVWVLTWAYSFNFFSIIISFFGFYLYFVASFNFIGIFRQIYKLLFDLSPMFTFVPVFVWVILGIIIFKIICRKIGYKRLNHNEMKNRGFINSLPIVVMNCATMGGHKTTIVTDMGLSQEVMYRDKAYELLLENDLKFPNFPWINLENVLRVAIEKHIVFNLATCKTFIDSLHRYSDCYSTNDNKAVKKAIHRYLFKIYGPCVGSNILFGYDSERYGLTYNDHLSIVDIWDVIKTYSQLYFFYVIESSLIISNYSVRTDNVKSDIGNFPLWDMDFFQRDTRMQKVNSKQCHILDFDMLRLGKKVLKDNPYSDLFEFGIVLCTEIGKERGNMLENIGKKKEDEQANPKNDFFDKDLKMIRHSATIDNFPFVRVFCDEQRPENLGADSREIANILHLSETSETKLAVPCFDIEEILYSLVFSKFEELYKRYRYNRSDNTLFMYLFKGIVSRFNHFYKRTYNRFGYFVKSIQLEYGTQDGVIQEHDYYVSIQKNRSKRFSTDCHSGFFYKKALRSAVGLEDLPTYAGHTATAEELESQHSYFIADLNSGLEEYKE